MLIQDRLFLVFLYMKNESTTIKKEVKLKPVKEYKEVIKIKSFKELNEVFKQKHLK